MSRKLHQVVNPIKQQLASSQRLSLPVSRQGKQLLEQLEAGKDPSAKAAPLTPVAPKRKQVWWYQQPE